MKELRSDILIVGAGLSGLMTAYALSDLQINIIVVDKFNFTSEKINNFDLRTTAIAEGSKEFFEQINIWSRIEKFSRIKFNDFQSNISRIEIFSRINFNDFQINISRTESFFRIDFHYIFEFSFPL